MTSKENLIIPIHTTYYGKSLVEKINKLQYDLMIYELDIIATPNIPIILCSISPAIFGVWITLIFRLFNISALSFVQPYIITGCFTAQCIGILYLLLGDIMSYDINKLKSKDTLKEFYENKWCNWACCNLNRCAIKKGL